MRLPLSSPPSQEARSLARTFYAIAGVLAVAIPVVAIVGPLSGGCGIAFSQADLTLPPPTVVEPGRASGCTYYVDPVLHGLALAAGVVLLATAIRFGHRDPASRLLVGIGAIVGIGVMYLPAAVVWWMVSDHRVGTVGPVEILLAALPFLIALAAAVVTWRAHLDAQTQARARE